ncbi:unnamed protein product [Peniophora sp. CBMAI 1063]|nr:unnamed protein product [Peniophora sp. CBMAI 1063]
MSLLAYPFHILSAIFRFIFQTLRIPIPNVPLSSLSFGGLFAALRAPPLEAHTEAERWVRALEEETGARSSSSETGISTGAGEAGPSSLRQRGTAHQPERVLPDFFIGAYEDALRIAQRELRIACIVLVSAEHDDDGPFKREVLSDPAFVGMLERENILVWGGDVRGREAWSAAQKLGATTYPFVAFAALQPPRGLNTSSTSPLMTVLSRHQGRASTTSALLRDHLTTSLLPRVNPFLARQRAQAAERELARRLRAEQDAAFEASAARDRQRAEEREMVEREKQRKEREEEERREQEEIAAAKADSAREAWRRDARAAFLPPTGGSPAPGSVRVGIRLPNGSRNTVALARDASVLSLFAAVDAALHPVDGTSSSSGTDAETPDALMHEHALGPDEWWGFKIFNSYPRRAVEYDSTRSVQDAGVEGSVSVELVSLERVGSARSATSGDGDEDGYDTEDE